MRVHMYVCMCICVCVHSVLYMYVEHAYECSHEHTCGGQRTLEVIFYHFLPACLEVEPLIEAEAH